MKLSDYVASRLKQETDVVFGYQGSSISHLIDSLCKSGIKYVQNYHEQASSFAACGYAEASHSLGVAVSCSGPGATNLITGIANAYYDSLPCLFISGQVSTKEFKDNGSRQNGFQDTKIIDIVKTITKYSVEILDAKTIKYELDKCIDIAKRDRRGPVFISLPHDVQCADIDIDSLTEYNKQEGKNSSFDTEQIISAIRESKRPLMIIGGGAYELKSSKSYKSFVNYYKVPFVASLRGLNNVVFNENYHGFLGVYGNRLANLAVYASDLLLVLGSRLDGRQTGGILQNFAPRAKIIHVDPDGNEMNREVKANISVNCKCSDFFDALYPFLGVEAHAFDKWKENLFEMSQRCQEVYDKEDVNPKAFVTRLNEIFENEDVIVSTDVGQNQMWVAQSVKLSIDSIFLTSGGHGSMGYSLPSIIGGYYAFNSKRQLIAYMGDGGLQMNIQELETIRRENIPAIIVVFVNQALGLIRDYQSKALGNRVNGSVVGFSVPDLSKIAYAYEMDYLRITDNDFKNISKEQLKEKRILIEVAVSPLSEINPEMAYKRPIYDQRPFIDLSFLHSLIQD